MIVQKYLIVIYACVLSLVWHYTLHIRLIAYSALWDCGIIR